MSLRERRLAATAWLTGPAPRRLALALAIGALGGALFAWLRMPLAWMLGAMIATTVASMAGAPVVVSNRLRTPMVAVLGVLLGSAFTADLMAGVGRWLPSIAALPVYVLLVGGATLIYLRRFARLDPKTAFFCAAPGGLTEMILLGERWGGDMRTISLMHGIRIFLVVLTVPFVVRQFEPGLDTQGALAAAGPVGAWDLAIMVGCGLLGLLAALWPWFPAPALLGPMLLSAAAHLSGLAAGAPPRAAVAAAQVVMGAAIGCRFAGVPTRAVLQGMLIGIGLTLVMLVVTLAVGIVLHALTGQPLTLLLLALVPGGLAEMSLIALALHVDPAFVATHHIVRIGLVVLLAMPLFRLYRRWSKV
ncbi:MAG TPA: AbrB family transcriptional regulator [Geminicoccaceae bacterium]|nr:AbrB family transcriptional regulator [Geminicoccaceae bacterium]